MGGPTLGKYSQIIPFFYLAPNEHVFYVKTNVFFHSEVDKQISIQCLKIEHPLNGWLFNKRPIRRGLCKDHQIIFNGYQHVVLLNLDIGLYSKADKHISILCLHIEHPMNALAF